MCCSQLWLRRLEQVRIDIAAYVWNTTPKPGSAAGPEKVGTQMAIPYLITSSPIPISHSLVLSPRAPERWELAGSSAVVW